MIDIVQFAADQATMIIAANGSDRPIGQRFTSNSVARFMAKQVRDLPTKVRLLDPGAGVGILTAAVCERIAKMRKPRSLFVEAWETNEAVLPHLAETMEACREMLRVNGHSFDFEILPEDFVLSSAAWAKNSGSLFDFGETLPPVDIAILNPPYFKLNAKGKHARVMSELFSGQPNMYAAFLALSALRLKGKGRMIAITPRSFCNGLYFKGFRKFLERRVSFRQFHLFHSRSKTFDQESVLQETVISVSSKSPTDTTEITSCQCGQFKEIDRVTISAKHLVSGRDPERIIRLPSSEGELRMVELFDSLNETFTSLGLGISTGPVVDFRSRKWLVQESNGDCAVPLLWMHNIKSEGVVWPIVKRGKPQYILDDPHSSSLLLPDCNYVLTKRFSAKEEARRIVACTLLKGQLKHPHIGIENHVNYIYSIDREMSATLAKGISRFLNSSVIDQYFRIINGNTQVNATEIRTMPMPSRSFMEKLAGRGLTDDEIEILLLQETDVA